MQRIKLHDQQKILSIIFNVKKAQTIINAEIEFLKNHKQSNEYKKLKEKNSWHWLEDSLWRKTSLQRVG